MALFSALDNGNGSITLSGGTVVHNVHGDGLCAGQRCPLHNPSDHDLRDLPLDFDGVHMIRISDKYPLGYTIDPDDYEFNRNGAAILRNSAHCDACGDDIESLSRHDFKQCSCGAVFVDGGHIYIRHGYSSLDSYKNTSITIVKE